MNNILLLGGTGFLGKPLLQKLETKNSVKIMIHNSNLQTSAKKFKGNISKTAEFIGMERSALHRKLKTLGIKGVN